MVWEAFSRKTRPSPKEPTITLGKGGLIGLNAAVTRNILGDNNYALLFFDRGKSRVGIKFIKQSNPDAYPIKVSRTRSHAALTGTAFMKTFGIYPTETRSYPATFDQADKILVADISGKVSVQKVTSKGGKAG